MKPHTILIIDDDPKSAGICREALRGWNYEVLSVKTTTEALDLLQARDGEIELVVTEIEPRVKFFLLLGAIRSRWAHVPVVAWTALGDWDSYGEALNCGATEFLTKPIVPAQFRALVKRLTHPQQHHHELTAA